jgi:tetratricopeptide (TPR) repeat protein
MARADRRRAQREARNARAAGRRRSGVSGSRRGTPASAVESQLFFTRLRTQAKWAFALMVIVFVVGFAFLGVGSGGLDLQSLVQDVFGAKGGGGGTSISEAQKRVREHPRDAAAYKSLANAYQRKGRDEDAIAALQQYVVLKPKDASQLEQLARLQSAQADNALADARLAQFQQETSQSGTAFGPGPSTTLGKALADPISSAVSARDSTRLQAAATKYQSASSQALTTFKQLAKARPDQTSYFALARAAEGFGDLKTALGAYKKLLPLTPDSATKDQIRQKIKTLRAQSKSGG